MQTAHEQSSHISKFNQTPFPFPSIATPGFLTPLPLHASYWEQGWLTSPIISWPTTVPGAQISTRNCKIKLLQTIPVLPFAYLIEQISLKEKLPHGFALYHLPLQTCMYHAHTHLRTS